MDNTYAADSDEYEAPWLDLRAAHTPLRYIFWGGLLCVIDITFSQKVNGEGFRFDFLNDFVGMLLITVGVWRLSAFEVTSSYANSMTFIKIVAVLQTIKALIDHAIFSTPVPWDLFWTLCELAKLAMIVLFCYCMRSLCTHEQREELAGPAESWSTTAILFIVIYAVPLGLFYCASLVALITGKSFNLNLGPAGLLALPIFLIPLIHFFVSTSRMSRAVEEY